MTPPYDNSSDDLEIEIAELEEENATLLRQRNGWRQAAETLAEALRFARDTGIHDGDTVNAAIDFFQRQQKK